MTLFKLLCSLIIFAVVSYMSFTLGALSNHWGTRYTTYELAEATPLPGLLLPGREDCVEPNQQERELVTLAINVLSFSAERAGFLSIGAEKFLSHSSFRREGQTSKYVCDQIDDYERAAELVRDSDHFRRGRIVEYQLEMIARLPSVDEDLAGIVAASAFNEKVQDSDIFPNRDIRPMARATLAGLGSHAKRYADMAFEQININDSMGTGAAQIAVAGRHPEALQTTERMMAETLVALPKDKPVPWHIRNRLYEMAYALAFGGEEAKQHLAPLHELMRRNVQSWAPPFGMVDLPPRRMCRVLSKISNVSIYDLEYSYCADNDPAVEQ